MKTFGFVLCAYLFSIAFLPAQDLAKEKAAIQQVIEDETKYFNLRDYDKWAECVAHDPTAYFSWVSPFPTPDGFMEAHGWEEISKKYKEMMVGPPNENTANKYDYQFKVNGNMAYVNFKEGNGSNQTRVLEKQEGKWRILRMDAVGAPAFRTMQKKYALQQMAGEWMVDPASVKKEGGGNWEMVSMHMKGTPTQAGLKLKISTKIKQADGSLVKEESENVMSMNMGTGKIGIFATTSYPDGWTNASMGVGEMTEEGVLEFEAHRPGSDWKDKGAIRMGDDGLLHYQATVYNGKGEKFQSVAFVMHRTDAENIQP